MIERRKIITVLVGGLALCAGVRADLAPLSAVEAGHDPSRTVCAPVDLGPVNSSVPSADWAGIADLAPWPVAFPLESNAEANPAHAMQPAQILRDEQNSLSLCLYALLGLGLCKSAPWVKKLSFGVIPDWYHTGGPSQIGYSFAISPDCLSAASMVCFIQAEPTAANHSLLPQHCRRVVVSLWRQSQFTPNVLAARGPPTIVSRLSVLLVSML